MAAFISHPTWMRWVSAALRRYSLRLRLSHRHDSYVAAVGGKPRVVLRVDGHEPTAESRHGRRHLKVGARHDSVHPSARQVRNQSDLNDLIEGDNG